MSFCNERFASTDLDLSRVEFCLHTAKKRQDYFTIGVWKQKKTIGERNAQINIAEWI